MHPTAPEKPFFKPSNRIRCWWPGSDCSIGGLIASALPRSEFKDELIGDTSSAAKRQVQAAAGKKFESAKNAVGEIFDETSRQAEAEGLTTEGLGTAAQDIGQRARRVAEVAVTTAFEPLDQNHQPKTRGEYDHG